jgi:hypothetical protein
LWFFREKIAWVKRCWNESMTLVKSTYNSS